MAAVDKWRTCLNESSFSKKLRENNACESSRKINAESKGLIAVNDSDVFIWDEHACHLLFYNLKNIVSETKERKERHQILQCTDSPQFEVEWLVWNQARTHLALCGQLGITVLEIPQKWGKFAEFQGGRDTVTCKCTNIGQRYFAGHTGVKLLQVRWHPASPTDSHVVFLTSDNLISIYDLADPESPTQTIYLGDSEPSFGMSLSRPTISSALGDNIVAFDFGQPQELQRKSRHDKTENKEAKLVWPAYCIRGNGDVLVAFTDISLRPAKLPVQGPLLMHPPAEDNYGTDACSILCLPTTPNVVVMTTCEGKLLHCLLLPKDPEETTLLSESSFRSTSEEACPYHLPEEVLLYVYETVELELALTTPHFPDSPTNEEIFTCPIHLIEDVSNTERYHCSHAAGIHTVALPWINSYQEFCGEDEEESMLPDHQESVVEHLICTRPVPNSPAAPVLGLGVVRDTLVGAVMLALSSDYEFQCLRLSDMRAGAGSSTMLSSSHSLSIPSPLRKISREPFYERIQKILQRSSSNPLIKSRQNTQLSQQECFQLLSRTTQVFREEYIQKQDLAHHEIKRRVSILKDQKKQQLVEVQQLQETRNLRTQQAQHLANLCEECKENQEDIMKRIEAVMRKLQARVPFLSESERKMKQDLENMEENLEKYQRGLDQLRIKRDYQQRQIQQGRRNNQPSPVIKKNQMTQLRDILKQEGDELAEVMKKINQLKVDSTV